MGSPPRWVPRSTSMARRWSASSAPPTRSRHSPRSSPWRRPKPLPSTRFRPLRRNAPMSLPALDDIPDLIDGVTRIESSPREQATPIIMDMMRSVYPHDQVFGEYCTVNDYIDCPPDELYAYLSDTRSLEEWTYSLRGFTPTDEPDLWLAYDRLGSETEIYTRTVANKQARTVDYHCAWDQGKHMGLIYLMSVIY